MSGHPNPGLRFTDPLPILTLSGGQDTGSIEGENGSGFQVTGIDVRSHMQSGFRDTGNREEEAGPGDQVTGNIVKLRVMSFEL
jgi:hypothetical protein